MNQRSALAVGALAGAAAAFLLGRRRSHPVPDAADRADSEPNELQQKLAEARQADVDESEFDAAGMAAETVVAEEPTPTHTGPPANEFEAMRRRVHEEARAAAEEMRRQADSTD